MAKRARKNGTMWWTIAAVVAFVVLTAWWLSARRAEAPGLPASQPGARALSESHDAPQAGHGEITDDEKQDLDRIIREGGAAKH
jgi:hypothetical protein